MADFIVAFKITGKNEGGYANDPKDKGGETWKGVARNIHPGWRGWKIVDKYRKLPNFPKNLYSDGELENAVHEIYKSLYWDSIRGDEIKSQEKANIIYDSGVNIGTKQAIKMTQRALSLPETGIMNKLTLNALNNE